MNRMLITEIWLVMMGSIMAQVDGGKIDRKFIMCEVMGVIIAILLIFYWKGGISDETVRNVGWLLMGWLPMRTVRWMKGM